MLQAAPTAQHQSPTKPLGSVSIEDTSRSKLQKTSSRSDPQSHASCATHTSRGDNNTNSSRGTGAPKGSPRPPAYQPGASSNRWHAPGCQQRGSHGSSDVPAPHSQDSAQALKSCKRIQSLSQRTVPWHSAPVIATKWRPAPSLECCVRNAGAHFPRGWRASGLRLFVVHKGGLLILSACLACCWWLWCAGSSDVYGKLASDSWFCVVAWW